MPLESTHIRTDKETVRGLKVLAGDKPVARFLREIATGKISVPVPPSELETLRASLIKRLDVVDDALHKILSLIETLNSYQTMIERTLRICPSTKDIFEAQRHAHDMVMYGRDVPMGLPEPLDGDFEYIEDSDED